MSFGRPGGGEGINFGKVFGVGELSVLSSCRFFRCYQVIELSVLSVLLGCRCCQVIELSSYRVVRKTALADNLTS